jgi:hypothetical protein
MSDTSEGLRTGVEPTFRLAARLLETHEITLHGRLPVLQQHGDNLPEVHLQLFKGVGLAVSTRETGDVTHEQSSIRTALDHGGERTHGLPFIQ